jgi:hypothetical protein
VSHCHSSQAGVAVWVVEPRPGSLAPRGQQSARNPLHCGAAACKRGPCSPGGGRGQRSLAVARACLVLPLGRCVRTVARAHTRPPAARRRAVRRAPHTPHWPAPPDARHAAAAAAPGAPPRRCTCTPTRPMPCTAPSWPASSTTRCSATSRWWRPTAAKLRCTKCYWQPAARASPPCWNPVSGRPPRPPLYLPVSHTRTAGVTRLAGSPRLRPHPPPATTPCIHTRCAMHTGPAGRDWQRTTPPPPPGPRAPHSYHPPPPRVAASTGKVTSKEFPVSGVGSEALEQLLKFLYTGAQRRGSAGDAMFDRALQPPPRPCVRCGTVPVVKTV